MQRMVKQYWVAVQTDEGRVFYRGPFYSMDAVTRARGWATMQGYRSVVRTKMVTKPYS